MCVALGWVKLVDNFFKNSKQAHSIMWGGLFIESLAWQTIFGIWRT